MPDLQTLASFFGASIILGLSPGPDNLFVLLHAAANGRKAGMLVVLGLCSGILLHTAAVTLGLAALFATSAIAFDALKLIGAGYLVFLAWQSLRAPAQAGFGHACTGLNARQSYLRGILMNISNPKVALFFLAFLPQFVDPGRGGVWLQTLCLGGVFIAATLLVFGAIAYFSATIGQRLLRSIRMQRALHWGAALVFVLLAVRLVTAQR
jgi:threonine/homoserine/homoserine lactone efflux protein